MYKIIYLIRHSENIRNINVKNKELSLSDNGKIKAKKLSNNKEFNNIDEVWSSTYKRAIQTANYFCKNKKLKISSAFDERLLGEVSNLDFWEKQMKDEYIKGFNGECQKEVRDRMYEKIKEILKSSSNNIIIVSHGAAITFLLLKWCKLIDASYIDKSRHIIFKNKDVLNGKLNMPDCFKLTFNHNECIDIERLKFM